MKKWTVFLPGNRIAWLESDDPDADLFLLGLHEYALMQELFDNPGYPQLIPPQVG